MPPNTGWQALPTWGTGFVDWPPISGVSMNPLSIFPTGKALDYFKYTKSNPQQSKFVERFDGSSKASFYVHNLPFFLIWVTDGLTNNLVGETSICTPLYSVAIFFNSETEVKLKAVNLLQRLSNRTSIMFNTSMNLPMMFVCLQMTKLIDGLRIHYQ